MQGRTDASIDTIVRRVADIADGPVAAETDAVDAEARWPEAGLRALQQAGLGGLVVPRDSGGLGLGLEALARVCERLGQACGSTAICFGMHCVGSAVIAAKATETQRERLLKPISEGRHITTIALSEPGSGSHFYIPETTLASDTAGFRVTGVKSFVTNGGHADSYVITTAAAEPDAPPGQFSCLSVPADSKGMQWGTPWRGLGMRGNSSRNLTLDETPVGRDGLLGEEGDQIWYVFEVVAPYFLIAMAGSYLGLASASFELARQHLERRQHSHTGSALGDSQVLQHRLGGLWIKLERTRRLLYHAAREGDAGTDEALLPILAAKAEVAECAVELANEAMTILGGIGYGENARGARILRDARAAHVMAPTTDLLKLWLGRALLDKPLLGADV